MSDPFLNEYFELLRGAHEHLSSLYPKGSYILAEKENWEALRQVMATSRQNEQHTQTKAITKAPPQSHRPMPITTPPSISQVSTSSTPPPMKQMEPSVSSAPLPQTNAQVDSPPEPKRTVEEKINRSLSLSEPPAAQEIDFSTWKEIFREKFPQIPLVDLTAAPQVDQTTITIVYEKLTPQEQTFLQNIARTCHLLLGPTRLIPLSSAKSVESEPKKMVLCYGVILEGGFPIEQLSVYLQTPGLKAQLWRQLSAKFMQKSS